MADLYLSRKLAGASSPISGSGRADWSPNSPPILSKISRASRASVATYHIENDVEELEMLLEVVIVNQFAESIGLNIFFLTLMSFKSLILIYGIS